MRGYRIVFKIQSVLLALVIMSSLGDFAYADKVCVKTRVVAGRVKTLKKMLPSQCPRGYTEILDLSEVSTLGTVGAAGSTGAVGNVGTPGQDGRDGALDIYGSGSEDLILPDGVGPSPFLSKIQFKDIYVGVGRTLVIEEVKTLRCTGTFTNNGTIRVHSYHRGGESSQIFEPESFSTYSITNPGIARSLPQIAEAGWDTAVVRGGQGGKGLSVSLAFPILGGIAGVSGGASSLYRGGAGAGSLTILCNGPVVNNGTILAKGESADEAGGSGGGGGGAGGGVVILASRTSVTNTGTVSVSGGAGSTSSSASAPGGGGGGGLVQFIAPSVSNSGVVDTQGGAPGVLTGPVTDTFRFAGAGGGASAGDGGSGGSIAVNDTISGVTGGGAGYFLITQKDPTRLF